MSSTVLKNEVVISPENIIKLFSTKRVYVFGYGSLCYASGWKFRGMKLPPTKLQLRECEVKGFKRGPFGLMGGSNFYGIIHSDKLSVNGVLTRIHTIEDWAALMLTECIYGLGAFQDYNYRVVDVTDNLISKEKFITKGSVVHAVVNEPRNTTMCRYSYPSRGYYSRVYEGILNERSPEFQAKFLKQGGFKNEKEAMRFINS